MELPRSVGPSPIQVPLDTHTVEIDWGDGSTTTKLDLAAGVLTFGPESHQYLDDPAGSTDDYTITVTVTDKDAGFDTETTSITVNNVDPYDLALTLDPTGPIDENGATSLSGTFADPGYPGHSYCRD